MCGFTDVTAVGDFIPYRLENPAGVMRNPLFSTGIPGNRTLYERHGFGVEFVFSAEFLLPV